MIVWKGKRGILAVLVLLVTMLCFGTSDTGASIVDTSFPDDEVNANASEANNPSATATITITMTPVSLPDE